MKYLRFGKGFLILSKKKLWSVLFVAIVIFVMIGSYLLGAYQQDGDHSSFSSNRIQTNSEKSITTTDSTNPSPSGNQHQTTKSSQQMVYRADLQLQVTKLDGAKKKLDDIAKQFSASLVSSSESEELDEKQIRVTYQVPQNKFQAFLDHTKKISENPASVQISAEDVGEELVDLQARIKAKKAMETRLIAMMSKASTTNDLLDIEETLGDVQEQIEQLSGRQEYLKYHVAFSTVTVELNSSTYQPLQAKNSFFQEVSKSFIDSCINMWLGLQVIVIYLAVAFPYLLLIGIIWLIIYLIRKKRKAS
jgi:hypothetical protein